MIKNEPTTESPEIRMKCICPGLCYLQKYMQWAFWSTWITGAVSQQY